MLIDGNDFGQIVKTKFEHLSKTLSGKNSFDKVDVALKFSGASVYFSEDLVALSVIDSEIAFLEIDHFFDPLTLKS